MNRRSLARLLSRAALLLGGLLVVAALFGAYRMHRAGRWLGGLLLLAGLGGVGVGSIGLGLFGYAFET